MANCKQPLFQKWQRVIDDFPNDLVLINGTRTCDKCGEPTRWASPQQKTKGRHWSCIPGSPFWRVTEAHHVRVLTLLLATFPGATLTQCRPHRRYRPGEYTGYDAGPCVGCRGAVKRYGDDADVYCLECRP